MNKLIRIEASVASEQQHKQDLRRNIKGSTNSRIHHFLPECIAAFYQNALRLFTKCIAPSTKLHCATTAPDHEQHEVVTPLC